MQYAFKEKIMASKSIEERVYDLEMMFKNFSTAFLQSQKNIVPVTNKADVASNKIPQVNSNTEGIITNSEDILVTQEGLAETYEEMNTSIIEVEEALAEVYEMIIGG